jgi:hypothetical protein
MNKKRFGHLFVKEGCLFVYHQDLLWIAIIRCVPPNFVLWFVFISQWTNLIGPITQKKETMQVPQNTKVLFWSMEFFPFGRPVGERRNTCQSTCDAFGDVLGNFGNIVGTHWYKGKSEKSLPPPPPPKPKRTKSGSMIACWTFLLIACNSYFSNFGLN